MPRAISLILYRALLSQSRTRDLRIGNWTDASLQQSKDFRHNTKNRSKFLTISYFFERFIEKK